MLAKRHLLTKNKDIEAVKDGGKVFQSHSFGLVIKKNKDNEFPRFGFIISTKISPHASVRNKSKRALSEGVRQSLFRLNTDYDVVFLAKPTIVKTYTSDLMKEVQLMLIKSGVAKK